MILVFRRVVLISLPVLVLALAAGACGSGDEDLERARAEGAREARLQERQREQRQKQKELEDKIKDLEEKQGAGSTGGSSPPSSGSSGRTDCGDGLSVGPNTTCAFARVVRAEYRRTGASVIEAYSPVTGQTYRMSCTAGSPHVCTGGNNASVYFP